MSHENHSSSGNNKKSLWYTYLGETGASVFAFIWIIMLLIWVFSVLKWG